MSLPILEQLDGMKRLFTRNDGPRSEVDNVKIVRLIIGGGVGVQGRGRDFRG
jgi:hypothetical protein